MLDETHDDKLARAAAALAKAEGLTAARTGGSGAGRRSWTPPPEDPGQTRQEADPESVARAIVLRQLSMAPRGRAQHRSIRTHPRRAGVPQESVL